MFSDLSDRAIAELCGVGADLVGKTRKQVSLNDTSETTPTSTKTRKGKDGKNYPAPKQNPSPAPQGQDKENPDKEPISPEEPEEEKLLRGKSRSIASPRARAGG